MNPRLYNGDECDAWHAKRWPEFLPADEKAEPLVIQPVYSLADWSLGRPLDAEEVVGSELLRRTLETDSRGAGRRLVLPPLRLTPRQSVGTCFGLSIEVAHQLLAETIRSAASSGYRQFLLFNTSPFLEEWIDVAARDLRVSDGLAVYCLSLSGLGLDFHPLRGGDRTALQAVLSHLLQSPPEKVRVIEAARLDPVAGPLEAPTSEPDEFKDKPPELLLTSLAADLKALLAEVDAHSLAPLPAPENREAKE